MSKAMRIINASLLFALAVSTALLSISADRDVEQRQGKLLDYRNAVDLVVYDQPLPVGIGANVTGVEARLRQSGFGEFNARSNGSLAELSPRLFCRRDTTLAVKAFEPFNDYLLQLDRKSGRIQSIRDGDGKIVNEAKLPSPVLSAVNLDENNKIRERVRYELLLGTDVDKESLPIKFFIEIEDRRFFQHRGNDWLGISRAAFRLFLVVIRYADDESVQGGSTITEQVAKLLFLQGGNRILRRIKSLFLADSLEQQLTKDEILELWLNLTVMGIERPTESAKAQTFAQRRESVRGFKTAARVLFNKSLERCTPTELATLSVLPRYPQIFPSLKKNGELDIVGNPNHRLLDQRRRTALQFFANALDRSGKPDIAARFRGAAEALVRFNFNEDDLRADEGLITLLEHELKSQTALLHAKAAQQGDGSSVGQIIVLTEVDQEFQRALSRRLEEQLPNIKSRLEALAGVAPPHSINKSGNFFSFEVQLDVVALWTEDGGMRALSSLKTKDSSVIPNRSNVNPRSFVASCAKPLHLAYALGSGVITLHTLIRASDCQAPNGFRFDGKADDRLLPMSNHLVVSRNGPFICLGNRIGIERVLAKWRELFPSCRLPGNGFIPEPYQIMRGLNRPEADLTPSELAEAYTALANRGEQKTARVIESIYLAGKKFELNVPRGRQVFKPEASAMVASLLRAGTMNLKQWRPTPGFDLALKTGSTSNSYWVVMFSPKVVVVVRYLIIPSEKLPDERTALKFSNEVERRFQRVFAGIVVKPFADSVLGVIQNKRRGWLRGTFEDSNVVHVQIDPTRECATNDGSGVKASYMRGTEPAPCRADEGNHVSIR